MQSQTEILVFLRLRCHANHTFRGAPFSKSIERRPMRSELRRRAVKWGWHSAHFSLARGRNSQATPSLLCFGSDVLNDCVHESGSMTTIWEILTTNWESQTTDCESATTVRKLGRPIGNVGRLISKL